MKIVPVNQITARNGIKAILYGPPGTAKTPLILSCPRPLLIAAESGTRSLGQINLPAIDAQDVKTLEEIWDWISRSNEIRQFETIGIDSLSQIAEIYLSYHLGRCKDGRKAYGEMAKRLREVVDLLKRIKQMHVYLICKQSMRSTDSSAMNVPQFPGKDLESYIPHEIDFIWHIARRNIPGLQGEHLAIQTQGSADTMARSRLAFDETDKLQFFEPPNIGALFAKLNS